MEKSKVEILSPENALLRFCDVSKLKILVNVQSSHPLCNVPCGLNSYESQILHEFSVF